MDKDCKTEKVEVLPSTSIVRIPGEPAIVINGLPPLPKTDTATKVLPDDTKPPENSTGFGEWLVGREVVKSFGGELYSGKITMFEEETGWYHVVYEDGDSEDLEWSELEELLQPLDINVPLRSLAARVSRNQQRSAQKPAETEAEAGAGAGAETN